MIFRGTSPWICIFRLCRPGGKDTGTSRSPRSMARSTPSAAKPLTWMAQFQEYREPGHAAPMTSSPGREAVPASVDGPGPAHVRQGRPRPVCSRPESETRHSSSLGIAEDDGLVERGKHVRQEAMIRPEGPRASRRQERRRPTAPGVRQPCRTGSRPRCPDAGSSTHSRAGRIADALGREDVGRTRDTATTVDGHGRRRRTSRRRRPCPAGSGCTVTPSPRAAWRHLTDERAPR